MCLEVEADTGQVDERCNAGRTQFLRISDTGAREDERGVLMLSTFAGAAHELPDALLVNPYDVQQMAEAIYRALEMPEEEQARRMERMRKNVREHNVYRWAAHLLSDLTEIRIDAPERIEVQQTP